MMGALVLLLGMGWQSSPAVSPEAVEHAKAGIAAKNRGDLRQAIEEFRKVTELAPDLPAAFVNLGAAEIENHDYPASVAPLERALTLNGTLVGAHQMLGYALLEQGAAAQALPHLEKAGLPDAIGIALLKLGRYSEAITKLNEALAQRPGDPNLLYFLGRASGLLSKQTFDQLESQAPDSARAHQAAAENLAVLRRTEEAEKEFSQALHLAPEAPGMHLELGELYATAGDWTKAQQEFAAEAKLQPLDAETAYRNGTALLELGKSAEALKELQRADRLRPEMPETLNALGKAYNAQGSSEKAEATWQAQLKAEPTGHLAAQAHFALATLYRKQGKQQDASRELQQYQRLQTPSK